MATTTKNERVTSEKIMNKTVVSQSGKTFGQIEDLIFDASSGEIVFLVLKNPTPYALTYNLEKTHEGKIRIPYNSVVAVGDFIVLAEEDIV